MDTVGPNFRDRLKTVDNVGRRLWVYADIFKGSFRAKRRKLAAFLVLFYLVLPWIHIGGLPLFQIDVTDHRLILLGRIFWPHEIGYFIPLVLATILSVFAMTAYFGRVWCGWACPQTVFLEFVYRPIERMIEGRPAERRALDVSELGSLKLTKKTAKWILFAVASFVVANSFLAYFIGSSNLIKVMSHSPGENPGLFTAMIVVFGGFMFNFGWFREQMCTITCPYGRWQSVLTDQNTLIVGYDYKRGEPRGKKGSTTGDCVDCRRCVNVCPTGVDIRDGVQLECIMCASCVDACNDVMTKLKRPTGLISYTTENRLKDVTKAPPRARLIAYLTIAALLTAFSFGNLFLRSAFDVQVLRAAAVQFERRGDRVYNHSQLLIVNKTTEPLNMEVTGHDEDLNVEAELKRFVVPPEDKLTVNVTEDVPARDFAGTGLVHRSLVVRDDKGREKHVTLTLFGPQAL